MSFLLDENLALSGNQLPNVITFRRTQISKEIFLQFFKEHYSTLQSAIEKGALITIDDNRIRIRELPIK